MTTGCCCCFSFGGDCCCSLGDATTVGPFGGDGVGVGDGGGGDGVSVFVGAVLSTTWRDGGVSIFVVEVAGGTESVFDTGVSFLNVSFVVAVAVAVVVVAVFAVTVGVTFVVLD